MSLLKNIKKLNERKKLGEYLLEMNLISAEQLQYALEKSSKTNVLLGNLLVSEGLVTEEGMAQALSQQFNIPLVNLQFVAPEPAALKAIPSQMATQHGLLPLSLEGNLLKLVVHDPFSAVGLRAKPELAKFQLEFHVAPQTLLKNAIQRYYAGGAGSDTKLINMIANKIQTSENRPAARPSVAPPVSLVTDNGVDKRYSIESLLNKVIESALERRASDMHFEPGKEHVRIRQRVDGILHDTQTLPIDLYPSLISRIKVMGGMDIAEKRHPQDGHILLELGHRSVDLRVSTLPLVSGEKAVIRILDRNAQKTDLASLGMNAEQLTQIRKLVSRPHGLLLVTGPTGSGKTTTVYSMLRELNATTRNIVTIEDPVEYQIDNVNQVQVNTKADVLFSNTLRSILRQDPDVIMVGEIRDKETADIAVRAALTGHLVISTIHTNSAAGTLSRLVEMGIEPFLLSSSLLGVVGQRLVRKLCPDCRVLEPITKEEKELMVSDFMPDNHPVYRAKGCPSCNNIGYSGRVGLFELLIPDAHVRKLINQGQVDEPIHSYLFENHFHSLRLDGLDKAVSGVTSLEEILKATL